MEENQIHQESRVPQKIGEYLKQQFNEGFLVSIKKVKSTTGKFYYKVDVSHADKVYHLKFNSGGGLISRSAEQAMELDVDHEEEDIIDD